MTTNTDLLTLAVENAELRLALAEAQEQCIALSVDAGELHAEVEGLRVQLAAIESGPGTRTADRC